MLGMVILTVVGIGVLALAGWLVVEGLREDELMREYLESEKRAFNEQIRISPPDDAQIARLRPLVEQVCIMRLPDEEDHRGRRSDADEYHVFLIDSAGATHEIIRTHDRQDAADLGVEFARRFDVELVDRERVVG